MTKLFYARHYRLILLLVVFTLPFISRGTRLAIEGNNNDIRDWLPPDYPESADVKWFQQHFPGEQFALVSWDGCTLGNTEAEAVGQEAGRAGSRAKRTDRNKFFASVITGPDMLAEMTQPPLGLTIMRPCSGSKVRSSGPFPRAKETRPDHLPGGDAFGGRQEDEPEQTACATARSRRRPRSARSRRPKLHMGGPPVDNVAIDVEGERTLYRLAVLSGVVGLGFGLLGVPQHPADDHGLCRRRAQRGHEPGDRLLLRSVGASYAGDRSGAVWHASMPS